MTPTAVRTWKTTRTGKTTASIEVRVPEAPSGGAVAAARVSIVGGKRAERAAAVIMATWDDDVAGVYGLRADAAAAAQEAHRLATQTELKTRGAVVPVTPAREAYVILVTDQGGSR